MFNKLEDNPFIKAEKMNNKSPFFLTNSLLQDASLNNDELNGPKTD